jgi:hypothetical protein
MKSAARFERVRKRSKKFSARSRDMTVGPVQQLNNYFAAHDDLELGPVELLTGHIDGHRNTGQLLVDRLAAVNPLFGNGSVTASVAATGFNLYVAQGLPRFLSGAKLVTT